MYIHGNFLSIVRVSHSQTSAQNCTKKRTISHAYTHEKRHKHSCALHCWRWVPTNSSESIVEFRLPNTNCAFRRVLCPILFHIKWYAHIYIYIYIGKYHIVQNLTVGLAHSCPFLVLRNCIVPREIVYVLQHLCAIYNRWNVLSHDRIIQSNKRQILRQEVHNSLSQLTFFPNPSKLMMNFLFLKFQNFEKNINEIKMKLNCKVKAHIGKIVQKCLLKKLDDFSEKLSSWIIFMDTFFIRLSNHIFENGFFTVISPIKGGRLLNICRIVLKICDSFFTLSKLMICFSLYSAL